MTNDEQYMQRCIEIAKTGAGNVAPNPMVGAVLMHGDRIISEGYHQNYGASHAEVNCIHSVRKEDVHLISSSSLYVSLEPCTHYGKTPPCADLIIEKKIPKVIIGCRDPFKEVSGKGIEKLQEAGITVVQGILENECIALNKRFFTFHTKHRPYILLKWAQTANKKIAAGDNERLFITNEFTDRLVHKWRSEEMAILVGTNTALLDNPELNNRLWTGKSPVRMVIDLNLRLPSTLKIFDQQQRTIIFNSVKHEEDRNILFFLVNKDVNIIHQIINACYQLNIQSIMVEGGTKLLQSFIDAGLWDEALITTNESLQIEGGLDAPELSGYRFNKSENIFNDRIDYYAYNDFSLNP